jgi:hypothetical protein
MSEGHDGRAPVHAPRSRGALVLLWAAAAVFLALLAILALRVATGQDPALHAHAAATPLPSRRVLVRRIYERRVIVHLPLSAPVRPAQASQQVMASGGVTSSPPVTRAS